MDGAGITRDSKKQATKKSTYRNTYTPQNQHSRAGVTIYVAFSLQCGAETDVRICCREGGFAIEQDDE